jgi:hypothetical protein
VRVNQMLEWLSINPHLIAPYICLILGLVLLVLSPILYQIRKRKILIINPFKAIKEYNKIEKRLLILGIVLFVLGFASSTIIEEKYGYYYLKDGVPTLLKKG